MHTRGVTISRRRSCLLLGGAPQRLRDDVEVLADVDVGDLAVIHGLELLLLHRLLQHLLITNETAV